MRAYIRARRSYTNAYIIENLKTFSDSVRNLRALSKQSHIIMISSLYSFVYGVGVCVYVCFNIEMAAVYLTKIKVQTIQHTPPRDLSLLMSTER